MQLYFTEKLVSHELSGFPDYCLIQSLGSKKLKIVLNGQV